MRPCNPRSLGAVLALLVAVLLASLLASLLAGLALPLTAGAADAPALEPGQATMHPLANQEAAQRLLTEKRSTPAGGSATTPLRPRTSVAAAPDAAAPGSGGPLREVFGFAYMNDTLSPTVPGTSPPVRNSDYYDFGPGSWNLNLVSTVGLFGIHVNADGTLNGSDVAYWNSAVVTQFINTAHAAGTRVVATLIAQDFGGPDPGLCKTLSAQATTIPAIARQVAGRGDGLNVDYESLNSRCPDGQTSRSKMRALATGLRQALGGAYLTIDTYGASAGDPYNFFDIPGMAPLVDAFLVMAYDMDYSNYSGAPLNCASYCLNPVAALAGSYQYTDTSETQEYVAAVPPSKVILGIPYYGRKSCVASPAPHGAPIRSPKTGQYETASPWYTDASTVVGTPGVSGYAQAQDNVDPSQPWATWYSSAFGCTREQYWDDVNALNAKYDLVNRSNLRGVGIWTLDYGGGATELWNALAGRFTNLPGAPGGVSADAGDGSATVSWVPSSVNANGVTGFIVTAQPGGIQKTFAGRSPGTGVTFTGLTNGTAYTFTVQAVNAVGPGPSSSPSNSVTPTPAARHLAYLAEGTTRAGFLEFITLANPGTQAASATLRYAFGDGSPALLQAVALPAGGRVTVVPAQFAGSGLDVSVTVDSATGGLIVERPVYWSGCVGAVCGNGGTVGQPQQPGTSWTFAEGYTGSGFQEYLSVYNPGGVDAHVGIAFYPDGGPALAPAALTVRAGTRATFDVNAFVGPNRSVAAQLSSDQPVVAERPMYFNACPMGVCVNGSSVDAGGVKAASLDFAEGYTGDGFAEYLTLLNPSPSSPTTVQVTYVLAAGGNVTQSYVVPPLTRATIAVNSVVGNGKDVAMHIQTVDPALPVVAERPMYFSACVAGVCMNGGDVAAGQNPGQAFSYAEGYTGPGFQEYLTFSNPSATATAHTTVTFLYADGSSTSPVTLTIPPMRRLTLDVNATAGRDHSLGAQVSSDSPIVTERPMYFATCAASMCFDGGDDAPGLQWLP